MILGVNDLSTTHPDIAKTWSPNNELSLDEVTFGSKRRALWICKDGHEYEARICDRIHKESCPICRSIIDENKSLAKLYPDIAKEWDYDKNIGLTPDDVTFGSGRKVWWKCKEGHSWQAMVQTRTKHNTGCPYCRTNSTSYGEQVVYRALKSVFPNTKNRYKTTNNVEYDIAVPEIKLVIEYCGDYWHSMKSERDEYKEKLAIDNGMEFIRIIETKGTENETTNDLTVIFGDKINESLKNVITNILNRYDKHISYNEFEQVFKEARKFSKGKIDIEKSLLYTHPNIADEWDYELNDLTPDKVTFGSTFEAYWICPKGHSYKSKVCYRTYGRGCPYCVGKRQNKDSIEADELVGYDFSNLY